MADHPKSYFAVINQYFDHIYVITIPRAIHRQEKIKKLLEGLDYEFFYGIDKMDWPLDKLITEGFYLEDRAKNYHRYNKPMIEGHIACSLSHRKVYEDIVTKKYKRVMIFEDDVVPDFPKLPNVDAILDELPNDWELLYWGYGKNERPRKTKQLFYRFMSALGVLKWNKTMIRNLYPERRTKHISKSGFHDLSHAYSITEKGARTMINIQTPIAHNADAAMSFAITNGWLKAYICHPKLFNQEIQVNPDNYKSLIHHS